MPPDDSTAPAERPATIPLLVRVDGQIRTMLIYTDLNAPELADLITAKDATAESRPVSATARPGTSDT
jgi:hypothetical protein